MMKQIVTILLLSVLLSCSNRNAPSVRKMTYYEIVNTVLDEHMDFKKILFEDDQGFDTITFRDFKLSILPSGQFKHYPTESAYGISHGINIVDTKSGTFPDTKDFDEHDYSTDSTLIPTWDTMRINLDGFIDPNSRDSWEAFHKSLNRIEPYDILILSVPLLNATHDTTIISSTIVTEDHVVERVFHLNLNDGKWNTFETNVVLFEVLRSVEELSSGQEKISTSLVVKGFFDH